MICNRCGLYPARRGSALCGACLRELAAVLLNGELSLSPLDVAQLEEEPEMEYQRRLRG